MVEREEQSLRQRKEALKTHTDIAIAEAEAEVYELVERRSKCN